MLKPVRKFAKNVINPITKQFAGRSNTPFVLVRHVGRKSGKPYETPIIAIKKDGWFLIELTYGEGVDWYRNVKAANGCVIVWHGQAFTINTVTPISTAEGYRQFPQPFNLLLKLMQPARFRAAGLSKSQRFNAKTQSRRAKTQRPFCNRFFRRHVFAACCAFELERSSLLGSHLATSPAMCYLFLTLITRYSLLTDDRNFLSHVDVQRPDAG